MEDEMIDMEKVEEVGDSLFEPVNNLEKALIYANIEIEKNTLDYIKTDKLIVEKLILTIEREIELEKSSKESFNYLLNHVADDESTKTGLKVCIEGTDSQIKLQELDLDEAKEDYEVAKKEIKKIEKSIKELEVKLKKLN